MRFSRPWRKAAIRIAVCLGVAILAGLGLYACPTQFAARLIGVYLMLPLPAIVAGMVYGRGGMKIAGLGLFPLAVSAWIGGAVLLFNGFSFILY
ncbi:MAG: hypothetical protein AB7O62_10335 [Pirellulales bacterium]